MRYEWTHSVEETDAVSSLCYEVVGTSDREVWRQFSISVYFPF